MSIFLIRNHSGSLEKLSKRLNQAVSTCAWDELILVVPTNRKIRDLHRQLIKRAPNGVTPHPQLLTLELLARTLFDGCCKPKRLISKSLQAVLLQEAVREVRKRDGLKYFGLATSSRTLRLSSGTFQKLLDVIGSLKESGVYAYDLKREMEALELSGSHGVGERAKLEDLWRIYEAYEKKLGDEYVDLGSVYKELTERLAAGDCEQIVHRIFPKVRLVVINGFDEFSSPELRMVSSLSGVNSLTTLVAFDCYPENKELFGHLYENYEVLRDMGFSRVKDNAPLRNNWIFNPPSDIQLADTLATNLFEPVNRNSKLDRKTRITLFRGRDRKDEIRLIARTIKRRVQEHPEQDLSRICLATYQSQAYTPLVREVFAEYGLPVNVTDRFYLSQSPLIIAILSLLEMAKNNFRRKDVLRALGSPYFLFKHESGRVEAANIYSVSTELKLSFDAARWIERIEKQLSALRRRENFFEGERDEEDLQRELLRLEKARKDITWLASLLEPLRTSLTPIEFKRRVIELLESLNLREQVFRIDHSAVTSSDLEKDLRSMQRFFILLDELVEYLALQGFAERSMGIEFYVDQLRTAVQQLRFNVRERVGHGVLVTSLEETRGIDFDVMFIAGLIDGEFPLTYQPEVFLSQSRQRKKELYHLTENRYLFYQGVRNFIDHLYLSYPERDGEIELVPSTFVDAILTLVEVEDARESFSRRYEKFLLSRAELLDTLDAHSGSSAIHSADALASDVRFVFHAHEVERSRYLLHNLQEFEGNIHHRVSPKGQAALAASQRAVYSITQLETYGKCPFKFFAERVLKLKTMKEPEDGLSAREKGSVLHRALFEFYVERREKNLPALQEVDDNQFAQAVNDLTQRVDRMLHEIELEDVFWQFDREELVGSPHDSGILRRLLSYERSREVSTRPKYFEVSFGRTGRSAQESDPRIRHEHPVEVGSLKLRGKVDRIELGEEYFSIIDYKTGSRTPTLSDIYSGTSFQLPLYLAAVEKILSEHEGRSLKGVAALYYALQDPVPERAGLVAAEFKGKAFFVPKNKRPKTVSEEELGAIIDQSIRLVEGYVQGIAHGDFPLTTEEKAEKVCPWCDFVTICRVRNRQWIEKRDSA